MSALILAQAAHERAVRHLTRRDEALRAIVARHGTPPLWPRPTGFRVLAKMILEQQVSLDSAATLFRRLDRELPGGLRAAPLGALGVSRAAMRLRARGVTRQKSKYIATLAVRVHGEPGWMRSVTRASDDAALEALTSLPGIGPWTAGVYLLFALRRPDIWPPGDLALHIAMGEMLGRGAPLPSREATQFAERWAPHRATAARILWHGYLSDRGRK